jgi:Leucine-rich repeat (LRR) protein
LFEIKFLKNATIIEMRCKVSNSAAQHENRAIDLTLMDVFSHFLGCGCSADASTGDHTTRLSALTNQLTGNWTQNLDSGTLAEMSSLESLDLSRNSIAELPNGTLSSLNRLKILQFGVNTLRKVKRPSRTDHQPMIAVLPSLR